MKKDILTLLDLEPEDADYLFKRAGELKAAFKAGERVTTLAGKVVGLIFDKASTRTRVSFETAMAKLGGHPIFISSQDTQIARNEPIPDTARVLTRYLDGLVIRTYSQDLLEQFAMYSDIPVINALTDQYHPTQIMSDLMTVIEAKGGYEGLTYAWVGDGNNVCHSWINITAVLGLNLIMACPEGYAPDLDIMERAVSMGRGNMTLTTDPKEAVANADVIYTDVWASMGQEQESSQRKKVFAPFQVNDALMKHAPSEAIVLHCLPAHRGEEISHEVLEGPASVVWDQAENKMHMAKAILEAYIVGKKP